MLAPVSVLAVWTANQVSDTGRYVANMAPLIKDPAIPNGLTGKLTHQIVTQIDVKRLTSHRVQPHRRLRDQAVGQAAEVLLAASDVEEIGGVLEPGSTAAVLVWENTWAAPFAAAVRRSGGQLVTSGRIPAQAILAAIDADRAA